MSTSADIVRAAIPEATDALCEHILWGRTPFPVGYVSAQDLYKAASAFKRAVDHGLNLCEFCHRIAVTKYLCARCDQALHPKPPAMKLEIQCVKALCDELHRIDSVPLSELEFYDQGKKIIVSEKELEDWKFTGLSNVLFVELVLLHSGNKADDINDPSENTSET